MTAITIESYMQDLCTDKNQYKNLDTVILAITRGSIEIQKMINSAESSKVSLSNNTINIQKKTIQTLKTKVSDTFVESMTQCNQ